MKEHIEDCNLVYSELGDEISKKIYEARIIYSLTGKDESIRAITDTVPAVQKFICKMSEMAPEQPRLIYGAGMRGKTIQRYWKYNWRAFMDHNPELWNTQEQGLPILSVEEALNKYHNPVVVVTNRVGFSDIERELVASGKVKKECIINMGALWSELTELQYFDLEVLPHVEREVFVDLGVYDGYSSKMFTEWCHNDFSYIWAFEPDTINLEVCKEKMRRYFSEKKFNLINKATWNSVGRMSFARKGFVDSLLDRTGEELVQVTTLDEELQGQRVTFIKMDIEGAELETLQGAEKTIKSNLPKLAISIYHKPEDIFTIPSLIYQYSDCYMFYLRHYSFFDWDTVLYAVPRK